MEDECKILKETNSVIQIHVHVFPKSVLCYEVVSKIFRTWSIKKYTLTTINTRSEATQRVMVAKLTRLTHKNSDTIALRGRELYYVQFSLLAASPETFGYILTN
jgi:hypothetical protein